MQINAEKMDAAARSPRRRPLEYHRHGSQYPEMLPSAENRGRHPILDEGVDKQMRGDTRNRVASPVFDVLLVFHGKL